MRAGPDGRWHEKANSVGVDFGAEASDSGLVSFAADSAHSLSYGLKGAASVKGTADGSRVTYENVLTDTDLQVAPTATGVKDAVVLRSADAANSWTFPLDLKGLTPVRTRSGSIDLRDSTGRTVERIPASIAYDSKVNPRSGDPATTHDVSTELVHDKDGYALKVTLNNTGCTTRAASSRSPSTRRSRTAGPPPTPSPLPRATTPTSRPSRSAPELRHPLRGQLRQPLGHRLGRQRCHRLLRDPAPLRHLGRHLHRQRFDVALVTKAWTPEGVTSYPGPTYGSSIGNATPSVPNACANTGAEPAPSATT